MTTGYEIHHGVFEAGTRGTEPFLDGCRSGAVWGTTWHGAWRATGSAGRSWPRLPRPPGATSSPPPDTDVAALRAARLDTLADLVADHLDTAALTRLISHGAPPGLPTLATSLNHDR